VSSDEFGEVGVLVEAFFCILEGTDEGLGSSSHVEDILLGYRRHFKPHLQLFLTS
jgi:hypothetical protein